MGLCLGICRNVIGLSLLLGAIASTSPASASYSANCTLAVTLTGVTAPTTKEAPRTGNSWILANFKVTKVISGGGHNKDHCKDYPSKTGFKAHVEVPSQWLAMSQKGARVTMRFGHFNGETKSGVVSADSWRILAVGPVTPGDSTASAVPIAKKAPKRVLLKNTTPPKSDNPLVLAPFCYANPGHSACQMTDGPLVIGLSANGKRLLRWDVQEVGGCADNPTVGTKGFVETKVSSRGLRKGTARPIKMADPMGDKPADTLARKAAWAEVAPLTRTFSPLTDLIAKRVEKEAGIQAHEPTVILGGPLAGWKIESTFSRGRIKLKLTNIANGKSRNIGRVRAPKVTVYDEEKDPPTERRVSAKYPSIEQVSVLTRGKKQHILIVLSAHDGGHCSTSPLTYHVAKMPKGL